MHKDNNNSPHGKFHRFLFPFYSKFSDLNLRPICSLYLLMFGDINRETTEALISANFCERLLCYICQALSTRTAAIILVPWRSYIVIFLDKLSVRIKPLFAAKIESNRSIWASHLIILADPHRAVIVRTSKHPTQSQSPIILGELFSMSTGLLVNRSPLIISSGRKQK